MPSSIIGTLMSPPDLWSLIHRRMMKVDKKKFENEQVVYQTADAYTIYWFTVNMMYVATSPQPGVYDVTCYELDHDRVEFNVRFNNTHDTKPEWFRSVPMPAPPTFELWLSGEIPHTYTLQIRDENQQPKE